MNNIVLKKINTNKIDIKENFNLYKIFYNDELSIIGLPVHCLGKIIELNKFYKFYIDDKTFRILFEIQQSIKSILNVNINEFINYDDFGNYLRFSKNNHTNIKFKINEINELYLNIKFINKINNNFIIHII